MNYLISKHLDSKRNPIVSEDELPTEFIKGVEILDSDETLFLSLSDRSEDRSKIIHHLKILCESEGGDWKYHDRGYYFSLNGLPSTSKNVPNFRI